MLLKYCNPIQPILTYPLNIHIWNSPGRVKANMVQHVAPTRAIRLAKLGMTSTIHPVIKTVNTRRRFWREENYQISEGSVWVAYWLKKGFSLFDNGNKNLNLWEVSYILDYLLAAYRLLKIIKGYNHTLHFILCLLFEMFSSLSLSLSY